MSSLCRRHFQHFALAAVLAAGLVGCGHHSGLLPYPPAAHGVVNKASLSTAYFDAVLASGPIAYYRLDDTGTTALDSSPNHLDGTVGANVVKGGAGLVPST